MLHTSNTSVCLFTFLLQPLPIFSPWRNLWNNVQVSGKPCIKISKQFFYKYLTVQFTSNLHHPHFTIFTTTAKQQAGSYIVVYEHSHHCQCWHLPGSQSSQKTIFDFFLMMSGKIRWVCQTLIREGCPIHLIFLNRLIFRGRSYHKADGISTFWEKGVGVF